MAEADDTQRLRELRQVVYREFVEEGRPPTAAEAARRLQIGIEEVMAGWGRLHDEHVLVLDSDRVGIRMAHPFSARQMHFVVASAEQKWWGGCAWDSFALPHLVPDAPEVLVATTCPACGAALAWRVGLAAWLERTEQERGCVMDLATLWNLARGWYQGRLARGYVRREPEEAVGYFRSVGLTGPFWEP